MPPVGIGEISWNPKMNGAEPDLVDFCISPQSYVMHCYQLADMDKVPISNSPHLFHFFKQFQTKLRIC